MSKEIKRYAVCGDAIPRARFLEINELSYTPQCPKNLMTHTFTEIFYQVSGEGHTMVEGAPVTLAAGELLLLNPGIQHGMLTMQTPKAKTIQLRVEHLLFDFAGGGFAQYGNADTNNHLLGCMYGMLYETTERALGYEAVCDQLLSIAVIQLLRFTRCSLTILGSNGLPAQCSMVRQYINNHFKEDLNLDQLAEQCGLNKYYLVHSFKKATGTTPINYLNQLRLQEAEKLLKTTGLPVAKVAQEVGFSSPSGFSQSFRRCHGVSPAGYRQAQRAGSSKIK